MILRKIQISKSMVRDAVPYQKITNDTSVSLLVVGDSTGVGVGASKPEDSVAGRLAAEIGATYVENLSVSGTGVKDLLVQVLDAKLRHYNAVLVMIGGNDIVRFRNARASSEVLQRVLDLLPSANVTYVVTPGNVGAATLMPRFIRPWYTKLNREYQEAFASVCAQVKVKFINLYRPPEEDPFVLEPKKYFGGDDFHPSSAGYGLWFDDLVSHTK